MTNPHLRPTPQVFTGAEAATAVRADFEAFRNYVRSMARGSFSHDGRRAALVEIVTQFDLLDDAVLARFGQPSPRGENWRPVGEAHPTVMISPGRRPQGSHARPGGGSR